MSEREIRQFAKDTAGYYAPPGVRQLCKDLLDAKPDLAEVLELLKERAARLDPGAELDTLETIYWVISEQFHIRLTDDGGWEYTEETE